MHDSDSSKSKQYHDDVSHKKSKNFEITSDGETQSPVNGRRYALKRLRNTSDSESDASDVVSPSHSGKSSNVGALTQLHHRANVIENDIDSLKSKANKNRDDIEHCAKEYKSLEQWINTEFDQIEELFERIIDRQQKVQAHIEPTDDRIASIEDHINEIKMAQNNRQILHSIRQDAAVAGISSAVCEHCANSIDLSMLDSPVCPFCETSLSDIDTNTPIWNPFTSPQIG